MKTWNNQPDEIADYPVELSMHIENVGSVEARKGGGAWWVTTGNLFHSQTIRCDSAEAVIRALAVASKARHHKNPQPQPLPEGCTLVGV